MMTSRAHTVQPDRLIAGWWSVVTAMMALGSVWLVADSGGSWVFILLFVVSVLVFGWFLVQALLPWLATLELDEDGIRGRVLWQSLDVPWSEVHLLRVDRLAGDAVLEIVTTDPDARTRIVPLPVGTSLARLHAALAANLGPSPTAGSATTA